MSEATVDVPFTRLEVAAALAAVSAVCDSAPFGAPSVLVGARGKLEQALREHGLHPKAKS